MAGDFLLNSLFIYIDIGKAYSDKIEVWKV